MYFGIWWILDGEGIDKTKYEFELLGSNRNPNLFACSSAPVILNSIPELNFSFQGKTFGFQENC